MPSIHTVCDYTIFRLKAEDEFVCNNLKLQKLLYYIQAWHLAFHDKRLFDGDFQAWIHGPVNREIYDRFKNTKGLYSEITVYDIADEFFGDKMTEFEKKHIDSVLEVYAGLPSFELEKMTHNEDPWIAARAGYKPTERCERAISNDLMRDYYRARLS
jgi:uncharacterized phage-associated protein